MRDQAHELRSLKMEAALADASAPGARPRTIVVTAGKGGVGISTLAVNLAASLSREGKRVLLASAGPQPHDIAMICGLTDFPESADGRQPVQGPGGLLILPQRTSTGEDPTARTRRVFESIGRLGNCADFAIVDAGNRFLTRDSNLLEVTDVLLYVTTSDNVAIMDTYAAIKELVGGCRDRQSECAGSEESPPLALLVNRCHQATAAQGTHNRIAATCRRFLRTPIQFVGDVPDDSSLCTAQAASLPAVLQSPTSPAAKAISRAAARVAKT